MQLDYILNGAVCQAAFQLDGDALTALKAGAPAMVGAAERTRDLWASLASVAPDAGIMIAKRDGAVSIASRKGGLIIEASGALNLGMLRGALQNEEAIQPSPTAKGAGLSLPGPKALYKLADWISGTEMGREIALRIGDKDATIWARQGRFATEEGTSPNDLAADILIAAAAGAAVTLSYKAWPANPPEMPLAPIALFSCAPSETTEWVLDDTGLPQVCPKTATLEDVAKTSVFVESLLSWAEGQPSEVAVLGDAPGLTTIARFDAASTISVGAQGLT